MDIANSIAQWVISQLESIPPEYLGRSLGKIRPYFWMELMMSEREAAEVRALLDRPPSDRPRSATVFIPGIMGSQLTSVRGISALLWPNPQVLLDGHLNLLDLDDDGVNDRVPDVEIMPLGLEKLSYLQIVLALARETRLYEFPYDWRHSILTTADALAASLDRWASAMPERRFTLVCHSMGGLVARAYLARYPREAEQRVARVIMLGTPLQGAAEAALLFAGQARPVRIIKHLNADNDVLGFARNLPSAYQLLPPPPELFVGHRPYPLDWDPYDGAAWQGQPVRLDLLEQARRLHELVLHGQPDVEQIEIAGCHYETITDVRHNDDDREPWLTPEYHAIGPESGDEQVPLWSTRLPGVVTHYVEQNHHGLVQNGQALDAVTALVHGDAVDLPTEVPAFVERRGPLEAIPLLQQMSELRSRLASGKVTREDIQRIFFAG
ncbi:MAG: lipase family alpha/beta hydrolase [Anaerolineae bacterium]|jgi:pimeloyl-ACP methyl ester carboxylesterase